MRYAFSLAALIVLAIFALQLQPEQSLAGTAQRLAEGVRPFSSLSAQERAQLRPGTKVTVGKRVTTLGTLRREHKLRLARFAGASSLGKSAGASVKNKRYLVSAATKPKFQNLAVVEPASKYQSAPRDMKDFCNAAQATVCLYYPASTELVVAFGGPADIDPFITDKSVCAAEGGVISAYGCKYTYPLEYTAQFDPGTGPPFAYKSNCDKKYWRVYAIDPHGAVVVKTTLNTKTWILFTTGSSRSTCLVRVWLSK
jgi:hypothetical protein